MYHYKPYCVSLEYMKHPHDYSVSGEEFAESQLISGTVLLVFLVLLNVILMLDWFGYLSIA